MIFSKVFFKSTLFVQLTMVLTLGTGCFKAQNNAADEWSRQNAATFIVEEVSGKGTPNKINNDWGLANSQFYDFKVCTKDMHTNEPVRGHKFIILDGNGNVIQKDLRSTASGCVNWSESVAFNPVADPKYISMARYVRADGIQTGQRKLSFAINPWSAFFATKTYENVLDLNYHKIDSKQLVDEAHAKEYLAGLKKSGSKTRKLWVDGFIVNLSSQGATDVYSNATLKLDIVPKIRVADMLGNPTLLAFDRGLFRAKAYLISVIKDGDKVSKTVLGTAVQDKPQPMLGDRVRFDIPISMSYRSSLGQLEVALILTPVDAPIDIGSFEGTFLMGTYSNRQGFIGNTIKDRKELSSFDTTFSVENYMKTINIPDPRNLPSGIFAIQPFEFDYIDIPFAQVKTERETPTSRTIAVFLQTVVRNPMENNEPVRSTDFTITLWDGTKIKRRTNQIGILSWRDKLTYKTYGPPHYVLKNVRLDHHSGFNQTIPVRLNPWALFGYALGYDVRRPDAESEEELLLQATNLIPSQMFMGKYILQINENIIYKARKDLSIEPYKSLLVNLAPKILNYSHPINGIESSYPFRDGNYLLKVGVVTDLKDRRYVSTYKKIVKVREGQIREDIRLRFPDLRQMRVKNSIYFEIFPIDYSKLSSFMAATKLRPDLPENLFIKDNPDVWTKIHEKYPNLDDLIEKDSGIEPRTFVASNYTPFSNKSEGDLRPTDDLDEKLVKNSPLMKWLLENGMENFKNAGEVTRAFSRMHLPTAKEITVDDLEDAEKKLLAEEEAYNQKVFTTETFVKYANADYVVLTPSSESKILNEYYPALKNNNVAVTPFNSESDFLTKMNSANYILGTLGSVYPDQKSGFINGTIVPKVFEAKAENLEKLLPTVVKGRVLTGQSIEPIMATRLCNFWFNHLYNAYSPRPFGEENASLMKKCIGDVTSNRSVDEIFVLDQKMRVFDFDQLEDMDNGYYSRINVSSDFRVSFGHSQNVAQAASISFSVGEFVAAGLRALSFIGNWVGAGASMSTSESWDTSDNKSSGLGASTSISGEQGTFHLNFKKYERCAIIRLNPDYIVELGLLAKFTAKGSEQEKVDALNRGVMLCRGLMDIDPVVADESVFYFTPDPFDGSMIEITDNRNYPWVVGFRGSRDFTQLMNLLKADGIYVSRRHDDLRESLGRPQKQDANKQPIAYIDKSIKDFKRSSGGIVTTYPGIYTVP